jgi:hypothetical protein
LSDASAGAAAPQPSAAIGEGAPQSGEQLLDQAAKSVTVAKARHSDAVAHVDWARQHAAGIIAGAEAAVQLAAAEVEAAIAHQADTSAAHADLLN